MPVLLRAAGGHPSEHRRPPSQASGDLLRPPSHGPTRRESATSAQSGRKETLQVPVAGAPPPRPPGCLPFVKSLYKRYHFNYLIPLIFIMAYMLVGGFIFLWIEASAEDARRAQQGFVYRMERELLMRRFEEILADRESGNRTRRRLQLAEALEYFEGNIGFSAVKEAQWSLSSAIYYCGTLFSTIGYGDIACSTVTGRIVTVLYSIVGIPIMLITLNDLGKFLYKNINKAVKQYTTSVTSLTTFFGGFRHSRDVKPPDERGGEEVDAEPSSLRSEGSVGSAVELLHDDAPPRMPVLVAISATVGWIFFCAALFKLWEDWTYAESCYFMFISLLTIGLGDVAVARRDLMVICFVFVIVGLSLVSMCINVIQQALEDFYINLIMKLIMDYQEKLAAGGDHMGASVGMMRMWGNNKTAKYLMPLLSKEKKKMAMEQVTEKAKDAGIEIPAILTDIDEKSGMPKIFHIETAKEDDAAPSAALQEQLQEIFVKAEALAPPPPPLPPPPPPPGRDADTQTEIVVWAERGEQTVSVEVADAYTETVRVDVETVDENVGTEQIPTKEEEAQTPTVDSVDKETATIIATLSELGIQTDDVQRKEQELQTYLNDLIEFVEAETSTETPEMKNERIQTPVPQLVHKDVEVHEEPEERKSPSKMQRLKRAFQKKRPPPVKRRSLGGPAMSDWKEVEGEEAESEILEEEELASSEESLDWDPIDGMHAERQLPVQRLKAMFDKPVERPTDKDKDKRSKASSSTPPKSKASSSTPPKK